MALDSYSGLKTSISGWMRRAGSTNFVAEVDTLIDVAEARMSRALIGHYRLDESTTLTTDSSGEATLPTDYQMYKSAVWDGAYDVPMEFVSWATLQALNPSNVSGVPSRFSIRGTTIKVGPIAEGDIFLSYSERLPALSDSNTTNWLLEVAPDAYLAMCLAAGNAYLEQFDKAAVWEAKALGLLSEVDGTGDLAMYANAGTTFDMITP